MYFLRVTFAIVLNFFKLFFFVVPILFFNLILLYCCLVCFARASSIPLTAAPIVRMLCSAKNEKRKSRAPAGPNAAVVVSYYVDNLYSYIHIYGVSIDIYIVYIYM